ncbi:hypothetical protein OSB04_008233 [Centaurea solstitialis]|uniref:Uncharacterized protein n=1 Tax=Centaurea solstitialis TaxID=347529 RepID=A0AA38TTX2_9ASTR|nr:hypothetical protein OSB04_008233 [Centaurea solstitialis]
MTTTKRAFSIMKIVKIRLRSTMDDDFLKSCLILYVEREIEASFSIRSMGIVPDPSGNPVHLPRSGMGIPR